MSAALAARLALVTPWILPRLQIDPETRLPTEVQALDLVNAKRIVAVMDLEPTWLSAAGQFRIEIGSSAVYPEDSATARRDALRDAFTAAGLDEARGLRLVLADAMHKFSKEFYL